MNSLYPWQMATWQNFAQQYQQQRVPHAVILTGAPGLGQLVLAEQIAMLVLCEEQILNEPCGQCHNCQLFTAGNHPDHTMINPEEAGKQIKIEKIRQLKQKLTLTASVSRWKTAIVTPAEAMNLNASNSLLKLLEEPQQNTLLILICAEPAHLPITIWSRCQKVSNTSPSTDEALSWIQGQGDFKSADIKKALKISQSAPLTALALLSNDSLETLEQVSRDFTNLLQHRVNPVQLAKQWQQYDLALVLNYILLRLKDRIIETTTKQNLRNNPHNWHIYDCIIKTIKLSSSPNNINKLLLIEQFMVSVMDYPTSKNITQNQ